VSEIPIEFVLFGLALLGVALFHRQTLQVALIGLATITLYKIAFTGFKSGPGIPGLIYHLGHEAVILLNLFFLLMGFALLARHFEKSHVPVVLPKFLPVDWKGAFVMLAIVWILSSFLDNIAAALIGGAMAHQLFRAKVHIGYLAAIVAAANAGGAWSVVGDTTTTMMWIAGISPTVVFEAIIGPGIALVVFGIPAAKLQHKYSPILEHAHEHTHIDWPRVPHSLVGDRDERHRESSFPGAGRSLPVYWRSGLGRNPTVCWCAAPRLGDFARGSEGLDFPARAHPLCLDDAGGETPGRFLANSARSRFSLGRFRQYSAYRPCH
jgi:Na+/H+ antiporter NhaD/arsenite permease-like protein